jgi:hypothetical protein
MDILTDFSEGYTGIRPKVVKEDPYKKLPLKPT